MVNQKRNPNRLVRIPDIGILTEQIERAGDQYSHKVPELTRDQQHAARRRLPGATYAPEVMALDERLELHWEGGDGRHYSAILLGLDTKRGYAVVTEASAQHSQQEPNFYKRSHVENRIW